MMVCARTVLALLVLSFLQGCQGPLPPPVVPQLVETKDPYAFEFHSEIPAPPETPSVEEARAALEKEPDRPRAQFEMGLALYADGRFEEAEPYLRKASQEQDLPLRRRIAIEYYLAASLVGQRRWTEAAVLFESLANQTDVQEHRGFLAFDAAYIRMELRQFDHAEELFRRSAAAQERPYRPSWFLAIIHAEQGYAEEAERYFRKSLEYAPHDPWRASCVASLGRLAEEAGDYAKARDLYEQALQINPDNRDAQSGLARLQRARGGRP